jgi:AraC-like DNA-binding protein
LNAWRELFGRTVVNLDIDAIGDGPFDAEATACHLPGLGLLFGSTSAVDLHHTRELLKDDDLSFMIGPKGTWTASQRGRHALLASGDGVLMWNAEVGAMTLPSDMEFMTFRVPLTAITPLVPDVAAVVARRIPCTTEALRLLAGYLDGLRDGEALATPELQNLVVTHVHDLLGLALGATRDAAQAAIGRGMRAARLQAVKADILANLGRADLSVNEVAARHDLTPRYVQLLFESEGITFSEFLLVQRLMRAHRMLSDFRFGHRSITSVAFDVGIQDPSYFGRLFRRRFGLTPTDRRKQTTARPDG